MPTYEPGESFEFALPDTGSGGETQTATDLAGGHDYVVAVLLRDHYCPLSRQLVQSLADEYEEFAARATAVVPVLADSHGRASVWQRRYDLPFGLLTDSADGTGDEAGFDAFGPFEELLPELPGAVLFEADGEELRFVRTTCADRATDGSVVETVLGAIDDRASERVVEPVGTATDVESVGDS